MTGTYKHQYFIGILPGDLIASEIREFQRHIAEVYKSHAALKPPVHATLISPFIIEESREAELTRFLDRFASGYDPFELAIDGFGSFTVGVVYAAIVAHPVLKKLEHDLALEFYRKFSIERGASYKFNPHLTIAYKDLSALMFPKAWEEFRSKLYRRKWMVRDICLFRHEGNEWRLAKRAEFGNQSDLLTLGF
ncbi:MAG: 2'-5' RNA ligase family protein [Ignavibacteriota bacterium]